MVDFYVDRIYRGKTTIDKVPAALKEQVRAKYEELHKDKPLS